MEKEMEVSACGAADLREHRYLRRWSGACLSSFPLLQW